MPANPFTRSPVDTIIPLPSGDGFEASHHRLSRYCCAESPEAERASWRGSRPT
jgi:hypothetical protein